MSVLACDREGCENIMCDNLSHTYGYICRSCMEELVDYLCHNPNPDFHPSVDFFEGVQTFMDMDKQNRSTGIDKNQVEQQVRNEFKDNLDY